jgi:hypothetical protein
MKFWLTTTFCCRTLKYFLRTRILAMLAAHTFATTDYNPFRDYAALEAECLKGAILPTVPELGTSLRR